MNKTKRKIFETSMKLFAEKGYDATSIEEITATVGVAKGTLYYHFASKEEIFNLSLDSLYEMLSWPVPNMLEIFCSNILFISFPNFTSCCNDIDVAKNIFESIFVCSWKNSFPFFLFILNLFDISSPCSLNIFGFFLLNSLYISYLFLLSNSYVIFPEN